jgi:DNA helicase-2/ATP-dependent DNA helicase PcrA
MPSRFLSEIPERFKAGTVPGGSARRDGWGGASLRGKEPDDAAPADYSAGERVRHAKFGVGEVVEAQKGRVVVRFGSEERIFVPELAPLSKA